MKRPLTVLDELRIDRPCAASWGGMSGGDRSRHCAACDHVVYDLAALTAVEATALLARPTTPCVRVHRRPDGSIVTRDSAAGRALRLRRGVSRLLLTAASWAGLAVATGCREERRTTMGVPCDAYKLKAEPIQLPVAPPPRPVVRPPEEPANDAGVEQR